MKNDITDVKDIKVGHSHDMESVTGCTVVLTENGAVCGVDVRGSAPGTRETDLLKPGNLVQQVHAILLAGGSAYGLDAAGGVMKYLENKTAGFDVGSAVVPIVPAAVLFDLDIGDCKKRPDFNMGLRACQNASKGPVEQGSVGAGTGATVGKVLGMQNCIKSGIGSASEKVGDITVGALCAVNAFGDVLDYETGKILAGAYDKKSKKFINTADYLKTNSNFTGFSGANTTLAVVATDAKLTKEKANKLAQMAHDGLAKSISPVHTMVDGDTVFALSTGQKKGDINTIGTAAVEVIARAVKNAVLKATTLGKIPCLNDLKEGE